MMWMVRFECSMTSGGLILEADYAPDREEGLLIRRGEQCSTII